MIVKIQFFIQCHLAIAIICSFGKRVSLIKLLSYITIVGDKDTKKMGLAREKRDFFIKKLAEWENSCNFAALEPAKPLNDAQMCGSFYYVLACSENASPPNIHNPFR